MRDLSRLPKAHLHLHLTGSMRQSTLRELAAKRGIEVPAAPEQMRDWAAFQGIYDAARATIAHPDDLRRVIREAALTDLANGTVWLEIQVNPTSYAAQFGITLDAAVELIAEACRAAAAGTGLGVGLIVASSWRHSSEVAERLAVAAARHEGVVGFGMSDDESDSRPSDFADAFRIAREAGLLSMPHSGFYTDGSHIRACVEVLGAHRIGHGITAVHDSSVLAMLAENQVTIELCPTSYPPLGVVPTLAEVPLRPFFEAGVPVALAADDPLIFGHDLAGQYEIARHSLGFGDEDLAELARQSIRASAAPDPDKQDWLRAVEAWLREGA